VNPNGTITKVVELYVCPTPDCPDYYGVPGMPNLHQEFTGPKIEDRAALELSTGYQVRHTRAECPTCRGRGRQVERVLVRAAVEVPAAGVPTPELPRPNHRMIATSAG
jgi:hypothetical protein